MSKNQQQIKKDTKDIKNNLKKKSAKLQSGNNNVSLRSVQSASASENPRHFNNMSLKNLNLQNQDPIEQFLNNAIHEYLLKKEYTTTLECFKDELAFKPMTNKLVDNSMEKSLIDAFDNGDRELFFNKWEKLMPVNIRTKDEYCNKLEFYLHIYFVVYPIHPAIKKAITIDKTEVQNFKHFLDSKGAELAQTTEFLPYYALPYVQNPLEHPSFKHIFTKNWITDIRSKLIQLIKSIYPTNQLPILYKMYNIYTKHETNGANSLKESLALNEKEYEKEIQNYIATINGLENTNKELMGILQEFNVKYTSLLKNYDILQKNEEIAKNNLFESHSKWITFSKEIITLTYESLKIIDGLRANQRIDEKNLENLRKKIGSYEHFLNSNIEDLISQSQDPSVFDIENTTQNSISPVIAKSNPILKNNNNNNYGNNNNSKKPISKNPSQNQLQTQTTVLNFDKIKKTIMYEKSEPLLCSLLQALRWRITRVKESSLKREAIIAYSKNDILDINKEKSVILDRIMVTGSKKVREFSARFINALASDYYGRSYLLESDKLVIMLVTSIKLEPGDTIIRKNTLGALQQLSLRKRPQIIMIDQNMIKWIIETLKKERDTLSEYSYEYATALLMNLSLKTPGKIKCEEPGLEVLGVLNDLLENENLQIRTFVNGTLYSLLSREKLKEQAREMGMNEILEYLMETSEERFKKQIQYIIDQLNSEPIEEDDRDNNNDENDVDDIEDDENMSEDEDMEDNIDDATVPVGEELLAQEFLLSGPEATKQNNIIHEALEESRLFNQTSNNKDRSHSEGPINRPMTPSMLNKLKHEQPLELQSRSKVEKTPVNQLDNQGTYVQPIILSHNTHAQGYQEQLSNEKIRQSLNQLHKPYDPQEFIQNENMFKVKTSKEMQNLNPNAGHIDVTTEEYKVAFESRPKVLRTPPVISSSAPKLNTKNKGNIPNN